MCEGSHFTRMGKSLAWPHHVTKRWDFWPIKLVQSRHFVFEVHVHFLSLSERSCICVSGHIYMCERSCICVSGHVYVWVVIYMCERSCICVFGCCLCFYNMLDNPEKLTTQIKQDEEKQNKDTTQYVMDTSMRKQTQSTSYKGLV